MTDKEKTIQKEMDVWDRRTGVKLRTFSDVDSSGMVLCGEYLLQSLDCQSEDYFEEKEFYESKARGMHIAYPKEYVSTTLTRYHTRELSIEPVGNPYRDAWIKAIKEDEARLENIRGTIRQAQAELKKLYSRQRFKKLVLKEVDVEKFSGEAVNALTWMEDLLAGKMTHAVSVSSEGVPALAVLEDWIRKFDLDYSLSAGLSIVIPLTDARVIPHFSIKYPDRSSYDLLFTSYEKAEAYIISELEMLAEKHIAAGNVPPARILNKFVEHKREDLILKMYRNRIDYLKKCREKSKVSHSEQQAKYDSVIAELERLTRDEAPREEFLDFVMQSKDRF